MRGNDFCLKVVLREVDYELCWTDWVPMSGFCHKLNNNKEFSGQVSNQQLLKRSLQDCSNIKGALASLNFFLFADHVCQWTGATRRSIRCYSCEALTAPCLPHYTGDGWFWEDHICPEVDITSVWTKSPTIYS